MPDTPKYEVENVRYVQVQDTSSGWPAMVKTVREADVSKIADCKEDIDTLLVFAGLYSAVLSAFIIESYKTLQQDNQDVMVGLMRQLVAQNFTSGPGFLNSTTPAPELPAFEPPLWAIRVNVLWFISLILSLAAASFGMLVKQWLREYLALEYTTPQQRLRARQYRSPALSKWKVFEIAAFLPVLLQISLGLFFIGLCFFTSAVHNSVRNCTVPVVCAWAFFLLITTIAPLFSPRCPFKTTFLKTTLKVGRRYIAPTFRHSILFISQSFLYIMQESSPRRLGGAVTAARRFFLPIIGRARLLLQHSYGALREAWDLTVGALLEARGGFRYDPSGIVEALAEEEDLIKTEQEDTEMLMSIDSLMSDDGLLPVIINAVQQQTDPASIVTFVLQIIGRRLGQDLPTQNLSFLHDFHALSKRTWSVATDAIAVTLLRHLHGPLKADSPLWMYDAVIILLSYSPYTLSQIAIRALRDSIAQKDSYCAELSKRLVNHGAARNATPRLSRQLLQLRGLQDEIISLTPLIDMYAAIICPDHQHTSLLQLLYDHGSDVLLVSSADVLSDFFEFVIPLSRWVTSERHEGYFGREELIHIVMQYSGEFRRLDDAIGLCAQMMLDETCTHWVTSYFTALHAKSRVDVAQEQVFLDAYLSSKRKEQDYMVNNMTMVLQHLCDGTYDDYLAWEQIDVIRLCRLQLKIYFATSYHNENLWNTLWLACAKAVQRYYDIRGWEGELTTAHWKINVPLSTAEELLMDDEDLAHECLSTIMSHPESYMPEDSSAGGQIPHEVIAALWLFATPEAKQFTETFQQLLSLLPDDVGEPVKPDEADAENEEDWEDEETGDGEGETGEAHGSRGVAPEDNVSQSEIMGAPKGRKTGKRRTTRRR